MSNLVVHFEIHASDPQRLIDYYSELLGWTFTRFGEADYWSINTGEGSMSMETGTGGGINGGLTKRQGPPPQKGAPINGADLVVAVDTDIDALFQKGISLGGTVAVPLDDMEGVGRLGYLLDPDGNVFGLIAPTMPDGSGA